jgi:hypothetical protein
LEYQTLIVAALFIISSERAFIGAKFPDEKFRHYTMKSFMAIYQSRLCRYRINDNKPKCLRCFIMIGLIFITNIVKFSFDMSYFNFQIHYYSIRITLWVPTANELSGISLSPQNQPNNTAFPIVIPGHITVLPPIQQSSPMVMVRRFPGFFSVLHLADVWYTTVHWAKTH